MVEQNETVTIVTGGSRGIGRAVVERLLAAGGAVAATGRNAESLAELESSHPTDRLLVISGDATQLDHQRHAVACVLEKFGRIDALVNNAGLHDAEGPILAFDDDRFARTLKANVVAVRSWVREVSSLWTADSPGAVVNISSIAGVRGEKMLGVYGTSKAAQIHLSQQLALELAPRGRVNVVAPGFTLTDGTRVVPQEHVEHLRKTYPMGRVANPEDIAGAVKFLLSDEASMITGQTLVIDGGFGLTVPTGYVDSETT